MCVVAGGARLMPLVIYEVYGHDGNRWHLEARFKEHQRENALELADGLAADGEYRQVRVSREVTLADGEVRAQTVYKAISPNPKPNMAISRPVGGKISIEASEDYVEEQVKARRERALHPGLKPARELREPSASRVLSKLILAVFVGAAAALGIYSGLTRLNIQLGGGFIDVSVLIAGFFLVGGLAAATLLFNENVRELFIREEEKPEGEAAADAPAEPSAEALAELAAQNPEEQKQQAPAEEAVPEVPRFDEPDAVDAVVIEKLPNHRDFATFLAQSLWEAQQTVAGGKRLTLALDRQGAMLFMAGAAERFADAGGWTDNQSRAFLQKVLSVIAPEAAERRSFVRLFQEYLIAGPAIGVYSAGARAASAMLAAKEGAAGLLAQAIGAFKTANDPKKLEGTAAPTLLMTRIHDLAAPGRNQVRPAVVEIHDAILRAALEVHQGIEVRRVPLGMQASFETADAALAAAISIAMQVDANTKDQPEVAFQIGAGIINASEGAGKGPPGSGVTNRLLAAVAKFAGAGQIATTATIARGRQSRTLKFYDAGQLKMDGLPQPVEMSYVGWQAMADIEPSDDAERAVDDRAAID